MCDVCDVLHKKTVFLKLQILQSLIKKELNSEPVYNDKYIKTKIKIYNDKVHTHFQHNEIPKDKRKILF